MPSPPAPTSAVPSSVAPSSPVPAASTAPVIVHTFAWWDRPEPFNARPEDGYTLPTALKSARRCTLTDVALVPDVGAAASMIVAGVSLHNTSASTCELRGSPRIELRDAAGTVWQSTEDGASSTQPAVILAPNSWATTTALIVGSTCGPSVVTDRIAVGLPGSRSLAIIKFRLGSTTGPSSCGVRPKPRAEQGNLGTVSFDHLILSTGRGGQLGLLPDLVESLTAARSVRRGSVLHYRLLLTATSPDGGDVTGELCPLYEVRLRGTAHTFELRCDDALDLDPGQSVAYDLQLKVPADAPLGPTALSFQFLEPHLPALTARVTIVR